MKSLKYLLLIGVLYAGMTSLAHATLTLVQTVQLPNSNDDTELAAFIAATNDTDATLCAKLNTTNPFPGPDQTLNGFTFSFGQLASGQFTVTVNFDLGGTGQLVCGFLVKNGGKTVNIYSVSVDEGTSGPFTLLVPGNPSGGFGQLSHVDVFCCPGGSVPDGGTTVMLLGAALGALGLARRFIMS